MNIVLYQPEIPYNTGNIGRSCVLTNSTLHLIKPLGFSLDEKQVKRAGMDYWHLVDLKIWESFEDFLEANRNIRLFYATTKTSKNILMSNMKRMISSCLDQNQEEYQKKF